jgi:hypothetical protein
MRVVKWVKRARSPTAKSAGRETMWELSSNALNDGVLRFAVARDGEAASFAEVIRAWQTDATFRAAFNAALAESPFAAFRWETPGVTAASAARPFEFVLLDDPTLARRPDAEAFAEHFRAGEEAVAFANLSGDATLVVPCPVADRAAYGHLAAFARHAPESQRDALWKLVGEEMARRIGAKQVWLSTAGAGVSWLHVRLDDRPKYYGHAPYRKAPT